MAIPLELSRPEDHPAVRNWLELHPSRPAHAIEQWGKGGEQKPAVFRLSLAGSDLPAVFAKRGPAGGLAVEREVHERILPQLGLAAAAFLGFRRDDATEWLFVEDVGDRWLRPQRRAETRLAGDWLGRMHVAATAFTGMVQLPDGGGARYLEHLRLARQRIVENRDNPGYSPADVELLEDVLRLLDRVESSWEEIGRASAGIPPTLVHGDFQTKNLRLRERGRDLELIPIDWEMAGWGVPIVDLADAPRPQRPNQVDLGAYRAAVREHWPHLTADDLERLRACGHLWRRMAAIEWETTHLRFPYPRWLIKPLTTLQRYRTQVREGLERLEPWLD